MSIINSKYGSFSTPREYRDPEDGYDSETIDRKLITYLSLWRTLGVLGLVIPAALTLGTAFSDTQLLSSISYYYYSNLHWVFIGAIASIAIFLWHYEGDDSKEKLFSKIASISVLGVLTFPTSLESKDVIDSSYVYNMADFQNFVKPTIARPAFIGSLHYVCAGVFFLSLAYLVLMHFTKSERAGDNSRSRIILYRICGWGMIILVVLIVLFSISYKNEGSWTFPSTYTMECIALILFGTAWLTKGKVEETMIAQQLLRKRV